MPHAANQVAEMGDAGTALNLTGFDEFPQGFRP
jgi:hypothetical protein